MLTATNDEGLKGILVLAALIAAAATLGACERSYKDFGFAVERAFG